VEGLEGFKLTPYFERRVVNDPERRRRVLPYVADAVNDPEETMTQPDGKVRYWRYVPDLQHHIRVVTHCGRSAVQCARRLGVHEKAEEAVT
jgi:hypothetical protein